MPQTLRMHGVGQADSQADESDPSLQDEATIQRERISEVPKARRCSTCRQTFSGDSRFCPFDGTPLIDAPDWNPAADPLIGRVVDGRYEIQSLVGEGGMGTVYEARHTSLGRTFAIKVLRRDIARDAEIVERFIQEAKAAAGIGHPNIVAVSDFGSLQVEESRPEVPYFVMEFLSGSSLASVLRAEKTLAPERVGPIMVQCAAALGAAHAVGVIHRDLKPDNIHLMKDGDKEFVKLLDFGVAKIVGARRLTKAGMVFGTPHYMAPEQAEGKRIDARADIYALGVIMYECFVGKVPFEADTYMGVLTKHMYVVPEPIERAAPDPAGLGAFAAIVMRCLSKRPEDRYASMADLSAAIETALKDPDREPAANSRPYREALRLRDHDEPLGRVKLPAPASEPLTKRMRWAIVIFAIGLPIAVALAFRAWRTTPKEASPPTATAVTTVSASATETTAPQPTASATPLSTSSAVAETEPTSSTTAKPSTSAVTTSTPTTTRQVHRQGEIIDPWRR